MKSGTYRGPEPGRWTSRQWTFGRGAELFLPILERLRGTPVRAEAFVESVRQDVLNVRTAGKWSAQEHLGHLADLHQLDDTRLSEFLRAAAVLTAADMTNAATEQAGHNERPAAEVVARLRRTRTGLVHRLSELSVVEAQRTSMHPRLGQQLTLVDWMFFIAEHDDHHLAHARCAVSAALSAHGRDASDP